MKKIIVIGLGNVGLSYVNCLIKEKSLVNEIGLIDINRDKLLGNTLDINHALTLEENNIRVKVAEYDDCFNADIVVISAGIKQEVGESRLDLLNKNKEIITSITRKVMESGFNGIFIIATNPVDIMTYQVRKISNFPSNKVIGTGTVIDSARLKYLISQKVSVNSNNIHAYVIGEHGDSSFAVWSKSYIGMVPIIEKVSIEDLEAIMIETKSTAYKIINYKGETSFAIGMSLLKITSAILNDENLVLTVSAPYEGIYIGMPSVIGNTGIKGVMKVKLNEDEKIKLNNSINVLNEYIREMEV